MLKAMHFYKRAIKVCVHCFQRYSATSVLDSYFSLVPDAVEVKGPWGAECQLKKTFKAGLRPKQGAAGRVINLPSTQINSSYQTSKTRFYNYQPQPKYSWALSKIEGKGKFVKT